MVKEEKLCGSTCTKIILLYCRFERDITKNMFGLRTEEFLSTGNSTLSCRFYEKKCTALTTNMAALSMATVFFISFTCILLIHDTFPFKATK